MPFISATACQRKADVAIILDESTSIVFETYDNWYVRMLGFATDVVNSFPVGEANTRIGLLKFSDYASVEIYLDQFYDAPSLVDEISRLQVNN